MTTLRQVTRVTIWTYVSVVFAISFLTIEALLRFALYLFPFPGFIDFLREKWIALRVLMKFDGELPDARYTMSTTELIEAADFVPEEHIVRTEDGYFLSMQRILRGKLYDRNKRRPSDCIRPVLQDALAPNNANGAIASLNITQLSRQGDSPRPKSSSSVKSSSTIDMNITKPLNADTLPPKHTPILLLHGFMQDSEVWVCHPQSSKNLPMMLAKAGYDVWLGNNRGTRYAQKHVHYKPTEDRFWDYSLDELALFDSPAMVNHVLEMTHAKKVACIGYSQGSTQMLAAMSMNKTLCNQIELCISLAPTTRVHELNKRLTAALMRVSPFLLFPMFGRRVMLSCTSFWQKMLTKQAFVNLVDYMMKILFGWKNHNICREAKKMLYSHLYSNISVKCVVHWFQIVQRARFEMFDEQERLFSKGTRPQSFPLTQISSPVAVFYGDKDPLPDIPYLLSHLPNVIYLKRIDGYEHLDLIWAKNADQLVFQDIIKLLQKAEDDNPETETNENSMTHHHHQKKVDQ